MDYLISQGALFMTAAFTCCFVSIIWTRNVIRAYINRVKLNEGNKLEYVHRFPVGLLQTLDYFMLLYDAVIRFCLANCYFYSEETFCSNSLQLVVNLLISASARLIICRAKTIHYVSKNSQTMPRPIQH